MADTKNVVRVSLDNVTNSCFVIMPYDPTFDTQFERVIRPAVEAAGLKCVRGDQSFSKPHIMADIWKSIRQARVIVAELTGRNPNVLYEVGLAHAIGKPIIFLTREEEHVPFDLKALRYRYYDTNDPFWGENLRQSIQDMVRAALDEASLSIYLEGISVQQVVLEAEPKSSPTLPLRAMRNVSGNWSGRWKRTDATLEHSGSLFVIQDHSLLKASMTVSFQKAGDLTVVQEDLSGSIAESTVILNGTSYTYIRQGNSTSYLLDNFELALSETGKRMSGSFHSRKGSGTCVFDRET